MLFNIFALCWLKGPPLPLPMVSWNECRLSFFLRRLTHYEKINGLFTKNAATDISVFTKLYPINIFIPHCPAVLSRTIIDLGALPTQNAHHFASSRPISYPLLLLYIPFCYLPLSLPLSLSLDLFAPPPSPPTQPFLLSMAIFPRPPHSPAQRRHSAAY